MKKIILLSSLLSVSSHAGIIEPLVKWKKKKITVCFANSTKTVSGKVHQDRLQNIKLYKFSEAEKDMIIRVVEGEFSQEGTGIHFTGWENCEANPVADAVISKSKTSALFGLFSNPHYQGRSSIGQDGDSSKSYSTITGKLPLLTIVNFSPEVIAHEFGHLAGLRHEHINPEAGNDPRCQKYFAKPNKEAYERHLNSGRDKIRENTKVVTEYDADSIMNYCIDLRPGVSNELLTILDQKTLKDEYALTPIE